MPSYMFPMGGPSLSSEMETRYCSLGRTRRLDLGTTYAMQEGKLNVEVYRNVREKKDERT